MDGRARSWAPAPKNRPSCMLFLLPGYYCPGGAWTPRPLSGPWGDLGPVGRTCPEGSLVTTPQPDGQHSNGSGTWAGSDSRPQHSDTAGPQDDTTALLSRPREPPGEDLLPRSLLLPGHWPLPLALPPGHAQSMAGSKPAQGCWPCFAGEETEGGSWGLSWGDR